ncbi:5'-3' exonuclease [Tessaracoccus caeni]|uniref:5'-3' exonuclease n=1 Tax=Tessaracoccus caeni TaxID=3031239 RepID=UPI0023DA516D|nr:5'-3' exonuclease [Tessaracoccus caeni]MDF1488538.1 5'-3' exonuclease [Tessaracoccus caeni]
MGTLMAFDTSYLYFRAYFGVPSSFRAPDGTPVNAVRGTLDFIARLVSQYGPDQVACAWDDDWRPQWRVDLVPSYKAHRVVEVAGAEAEQVEADLSIQVPLIRECLDALGLPVVGAAEHEADDVLASLAAANDSHTFVVTGDRDLFQLASADTSVVYIARSVAKHEVVTPDLLVEKYGVSPDRYVDFAVLRGDPSDGLPGVKGIGEKSAASLVTTYPSLSAMLAAAEDPSSPMAKAMRAKLLAAADYLEPARQVVACVLDLPLPTPTRRGVDEQRAAELGERLGLGGSMTRAIAALS